MVILIEAIVYPCFSLHHPSPYLVFNFYFIFFILDFQVYIYLLGCFLSFIRCLPQMHSRSVLNGSIRKSAKLHRMLPEDMVPVMLHFVALFLSLGKRIAPLKWIQKLLISESLRTITKISLMYLYGMSRLLQISPTFLMCSFQIEWRHLQAA